jgi:hypothetical protein
LKVARYEAPGESSFQANRPGPDDRLLRGEVAPEVQKPTIFYRPCGTEAFALRFPATSYGATFKCPSGTMLSMRADQPGRFCLKLKQMGNRRVVTEKRHRRQATI